MPPFIEDGYEADILLVPVDCLHRPGQVWEYPVMRAVSPSGVISFLPAQDGCDQANGSADCLQCIQRMMDRYVSSPRTPD